MALRIALVFLATRALLIIVALVDWPLARCESYAVYAADGTPGEQAITWRTNAAGERVMMPGDPPAWLDAFIRMDGGYYLQIAAFGYERGPDGGTPHVAGFFPGYPVAVRGATWLLNALAGRPGAPMIETPRTAFFAASLVSNVALLLSALILFALARPHVGEHAAGSAALLTLTCPVAFLGSAVLAEATFMLFAVLSLHLALRGRIAIACAVAAAAAFTRPVGVLLAVPLAMLSWKPGRTWRDRVAVLLVLVGPAALMCWHARTLGDPSAYVAIQREYGHAGFPDFGGVADLFAFAGHDALTVIRNAVQLVALLAGGFCLWVLARARDVPRALAAWTLVSIAVVLLSGHVISLPRYLYAIFPLFIGAGLMFPRGRAGAAVHVACAVVQAAAFVVFARAWPIVV